MKRITRGVWDADEIDRELWFQSFDLREHLRKNPHDQILWRGLSLMDRAKKVTVRRVKAELYRQAAVVFSVCGKEDVARRCFRAHRNLDDPTPLEALYQKMSDRLDREFRPLLRKRRRPKK